MINSSFIRIYINHRSEWALKQVSSITCARVIYTLERRWTKHLLSFSWFIPMASVNMAKLSKEQALLAVGWTSERQNRLFCSQLLVSQNCFYSMDLFQSWKKNLDCGHPKQTKDILSLTPWKVAKGINVTREWDRNSFVTPKFYRKARVIREFINLCARFVSWNIRDPWIFSFIFVTIVTISLKPCTPEEKFEVFPLTKSRVNFSKIRAGNGLEPYSRSFSSWLL